MVTANAAEVFDGAKSPDGVQTKTRGGGGGGRRSFGTQFKLLIGASAVFGLLLSLTLSCGREMIFKYIYFSPPRRGNAVKLL